MGRHVTTLMKAGLSALHYSGAGSLAAPLTRGAGVVFMMHHVSPAAAAPFEPNRILRITPAFLEAVVTRVIELGFDLVHIGEVPGRLAAGGGSRPFACFTFDDGYRDNMEHAFPVLRRLGAPYTLYVPTDYPDGRGDLWWLVLEEVIRRADTVAPPIAEGVRELDCRSLAAKHRVFQSIYWDLRARPEAEARDIVGRMAMAEGIDAAQLCRRLVMTWDEIRAAARDPLMTVGAHTCRHLALSKLSEAEAQREMVESRRRIEDELGRSCRHFSYPYGCRRAAGPREFRLAAEAGFVTAVTTRKGLVHRAAGDALMAIPRLSLNGDFQDLRYVETMLSGVPFAVWNAVRRVALPQAV